MGNGELVISKPKKRLKARGILNDCADATMIDGEKGAWERAVVEKYSIKFKAVVCKKDCGSSPQ